MTDSQDDGQEERYEGIELIARVRADGQSWFDIISDLITADCQGSEEEDSCTCCMASMGGTTGTLDQCYRHQGVADDLVEVNKADVLLLISQLATSGYDKSLPGLEETIVRLHKECTWWEDWLASLPDEEEEES